MHSELSIVFLLLFSPFFKRFVLNMTLDKYGFLFGVIIHGFFYICWTWGRYSVELN